MTKYNFDIRRLGKVCPIKCTVNEICGHTIYSIFKSFSVLSNLYS